MEYYDRGKRAAVNRHLKELTGDEENDDIFPSAHSVQRKKHFGGNAARRLHRNDRLTLKTLSRELPKGGRVSPRMPYSSLPSTDSLTPQERVERGVRRYLWKRGIRI